MNTQGSRKKVADWFFPFLQSVSHIFKKGPGKLQSKRAMAAILILAVLIVSRAVIKNLNQTPFQDPSGDWKIASNLVQGKGYVNCVTDYFPFCEPSNQVTASREPAPVLLLAIAMLVYPAQISGIVAWGILYIATSLVIFLILKKRGARVALFASFLWTISIPVISQINDDTGDLAAAFFLSLGYLYFEKAREGNRIGNWILSGLLLGLASLSRTVVFGIAIGLFLVLLAAEIKFFSPGWLNRTKPLLILFASLLLAISPWIIRNEIALGSPVFGSTLTGYNVYRMNSIISQDGFQPHYVGWKEGAQNIDALIQKSNLSGNENEAQMQSFYMKAGIEVVSKHPLRYIELSLFRFFSLWFNTSVENAYGERTSDAEDRLMLIEQGLLLIGVILGTIQNLKDKWQIIVCVVLGCGAYMAIDAQIRYLVDIMPLVIILAGYSLVNVERWTITLSDHFDKKSGRVPLSRQRENLIKSQNGY